MGQANADDWQEGKLNLFGSGVNKLLGSDGIRLMGLRIWRVADWGLARAIGTSKRVLAVSPSLWHPRPRDPRRNQWPRTFGGVTLVPNCSPQWTSQAW